jgi:hypothetical protein
MASGFVSHLPVVEREGGAEDDVGEAGVGGVVEEVLS